jgi:hypothetical protein
MKALALAAMTLLTLAACSHNSGPAQDQKYQLQTEEKAHIPGECPSVQSGAFQYDNDPTRVVTWSLNVKTGVIAISGGGFPDYTVDGSDVMDAKFGHHIAYCAHGHIYFQDNGPSGQDRGVLSPDSTGYSYFTIDVNYGGQTSTSHFTKL